MPFPVNNIRALCKEKGTTLAALEKKLGFGNGVIAGWETAKNWPPYDRLYAVAVALEVTVDELAGNEKAPASVSESKRDYVDRTTKMIRTPDPISILAAQYDVPPAVLADIAGCDITKADMMIFGIEQPTDKELLRIASVFCVSPDSLRHGLVPLYANQYVVFDIAHRKSTRIPQQEDPKS